jgi:hypothetical protein
MNYGKVEIMTPLPIEFHTSGTATSGQSIPPTYWPVMADCRRITDPKTDNSSLQCTAEQEIATKYRRLALH